MVLRCLPKSAGSRIGLGLAAGFLAILGGTIWRMRSQDGIPDVGPEETRIEPNSRAVATSRSEAILSPVDRAGSVP